MAHVTLIDMPATEAQKVLLKSDSYINFDLPNYFLKLSITTTGLKIWAT
jgi:hypothetical protein